MLSFLFRSGGLWSLPGRGTPAATTKVDHYADSSEVGLLMVGLRGPSDPDATVRCTVRDRVATITLNRPHALNAVTLDMEALLDETLREADADPGVGCIVLTGEGRGFCAGDDVKEQWSDPRMAEALEQAASPRASITP